MDEKNNQSKNELTIDDLAAMVQKGFLSLEERIEKVESSIKEVRSNTEDIKADLNKKVGRIEHNELIYRVEKLEKNFA